MTTKLICDTICEANVIGALLISFVERPSLFSLPPSFVNASENINFVERKREKMSYYGNIREEELKNRVAADWFAAYDWTGIIGNIDFSVAIKQTANSEKRLWDEREFLLWAEAKQGTKHDIYESFVQLILTIGRARTNETYLPPSFLGAFDAEKIAFIPYNDVMEVFSQNDFNWNVTPSDHSSREFLLLLNLVKQTLEDNAYLFHFDNDAAELRKFIRGNFHLNKGDISTIRINKNNFTHVYLKWLREVKPSLDINWEGAKQENLLDADFYLADILSENNATIREKLFVLLKNDHYLYNIHRRATGAIHFDRIDFNDHQKAHNRFWKRYLRPPEEEYWDYIVNRRDLLVPQDIRERKGSFFTPSRWVELSQEYIARELGEDWQDNYFVWDCCAGTGNLLAGLTNKYQIYASTLDDADVRVMKDLIHSNSLNLLDEHVFQFDFLNGSFDNLPPSLKDIIADPEKRKRLVVYINPPYAEAGNARKITGTGEHKVNVAVQNLIYKKYLSQIGLAGRELFAQFFIRIYCEIPGCVLAEFSKLKILQAPNFKDFRNVFQAKLCSLFLVPADTFDNVKGQFPIGFHIWNTGKKDVFKQVISDVYDRKGDFTKQKIIYAENTYKYINDWIVAHKDEKGFHLGFMNNGRNDFQNKKFVYIVNRKDQMPVPRGWWITPKNISLMFVYLAVRCCIEATWLNDRDQFFSPKDSWAEDLEFQNDCLAYTLLHGQNRISMAQGTNHWIPFTEEEVGARDRFESHFMSDYIRGKNRPTSAADLFGDGMESTAPHPIVFSAEATAVIDAGRDLWRYYHSFRAANPNAAFYDIRLHFQGTNDKGKMNPDSTDEQYMRLIRHLRACIKTLGDKIAPKVYEHGFLMN